MKSGSREIFIKVIHHPQDPQSLTVGAAPGRWWCPGDSPQEGAGDGGTVHGKAGVRGGQPMGRGGDGVGDSPWEGTGDGVGDRSWEGTGDSVGWRGSPREGAGVRGGRGTRKSTGTFPSCLSDLPGWLEEEVIQRRPALEVPRSQRLGLVRSSRLTLGPALRGMSVRTLQ